MSFTEKTIKIAALCQVIMAYAVNCRVVNAVDTTQEITNENFYNFLRHPCNSPFDFEDALIELKRFEAVLDEKIKCFGISKDIIHYIKTCPDVSRIIKKLKEEKKIGTFNNQFQKYAIFIHNVIKSIPEDNDRRRCYRNLLDSMRPVICKFSYEKKFVGELKGYNTKCISKNWDRTNSNAFDQQFIQSFEYFIYNSSVILDRIDDYDDDYIYL